MNYNKLNLQPGETVRLDKDFRNSSIVVIKSISPKGMYSLVHSAKIKKSKDSDCWETMTNRLTRIEKPNLNNLFENNSDCYADTREDCDDTIPPTQIEGDVVQAMTKERFVEVVGELFVVEPYGIKERTQGVKEIWSPKI